MAKAKDRPNNVFTRFVGYIKGVWVELKRVVWPGKSEVLNSSVVVIVTLLFFIAFTLVVDQTVVQAIDLISRIGG